MRCPACTLSACVSTCGGVQCRKVIERKSDRDAAYWPERMLSALTWKPIRRYIEFKAKPCSIHEDADRVPHDGERRLR